MLHSVPLFQLENVSQCMKMCSQRRKEKKETCLHHDWEVKNGGVDGVRVPLLPSDVILGLILQYGDGLRTMPTTDTP